MIRLLYDQNLSPALVRTLDDLFPGSAHVFGLGMGESGDTDIWRYAQEHGLIVVTKDRDFYQRSLARGAPPKIVWLRLGNCSTEHVELVLRSQAIRVRLFANDPEVNVVILTR